MKTITKKLKDVTLSEIVYVCQNRSCCQDACPFWVNERQLCGARNIKEGELERKITMEVNE